MSCPARDDGVHDLTKSSTCACGYQLTTLPFSVEICVMHKDETLVNEIFSCDDIDTAIAALEDAVHKLEDVEIDEDEEPLREAAEGPR